MATLTPYRGLDVIDGGPSGGGGAAIQDDLMSLVDWHPHSEWAQTGAPGGSNGDDGDNGPENYYPGSFWLDTSTSPGTLYVCQSAAIPSAVWLRLLSAVVQDTAPKLGGNLDVNGHAIVSASNGNITLLPNGTGKVGVNTSSPSYPLHVTLPNGSNDGIVARGSASSYTGNYLNLQYDGTYSAFKVRFAVGVGTIVETDAALAGMILRAGNILLQKNSGDTIVNFADSVAWSDSVQSHWIARGLVTTPGGIIFTPNGGPYERTLFSSKGFLISGEPPQFTVTPPNAMFEVRCDSTSKVVQVLKGVASQAANLTQWRDASGNILALIDKDGAFIFNEQGADADCRIEGDSDANLLYTDAGNDRVGVGTNAPDEKFDVAGLSRAQTFTADGDVGSGTASTVRLTGVTDTPTTNPGWASSNSAPMNVPDGYIKMYVGTQAVVVPYWNT